MTVAKNHPLYEKAAAGHWLHAADVAVLVRLTLAKAFPETKFYVRSENFSMGSAVRIYYDGATGPSRRDVDAAVHAFEGKGFDGMIDMEYSRHAWLLPDGSAVFGGTEGTAGSRGTVSKDEVPRPVPGAVRPHWSSWVSVYNTLPYEIEHAAEEKARKARVRERNAAIRAMTGRKGISRWDVRAYRAANR